MHVTTGLVILGVALVVARTAYDLGGASFWVDEMRSVDLARDFAVLWRELRTHEANMWLYYVLLHAWMKLGDGEVMARLPSVVFAAASVPVVYALAARLFDRRVGAFAALALGANAFLLHHAQEARGYTLLVLLVLVSTYTFVRVVDRPTWRDVVLFGVSTALAFYVHFFAVLVLVAQGTTLLVFPRREQRERPVLAGLGVAALLIAPGLALEPLGSGQIDWIEPLRLRDVIEAFYLLAGHTVPMTILSLVALGFVFARQWRARAERVSPDARFRAALVIAWLVVPVVAAALASLLLHTVFVARYLIVSLPAMAIVFGLALASIERKTAAIAAMVVFALASGHALLHLDFGGREDWRGVAKRIAADARPGDAIVVYAYFLRAPLEHYLAEVAPRGAPEIVEVASGPYKEGGGTRLPDPNLEIVEGLARAGRRVWLVLGHDRFEHIGRAHQSASIRDTLARVSHEEPMTTFEGVRLLRFSPRADGAPRTEVEPR